MIRSSFPGNDRIKAHRRYRCAIHNRLRRSSPAVSPRKGNVPVAISYKHGAKRKQVAAVVQLLPRTCSGLM